MDGRRHTQGSGDAESVPGAVGVIGESCGGHTVLRRDARKWWCHPNRLAIVIQDKYPLGAQSHVALAYLVDGRSDALSDFARRGPRADRGKVLVDSELHRKVTIHRSALSGCRARGSCP